MKKLADRIIMEVKGPASQYGGLLEEKIVSDEIIRSIALSTSFSDYSFFTTVSPIVRADGTVSYLTPEEIRQTAKMIEKASGSKKHPYRLRYYNPENTRDDGFKSVEPLSERAMFKYRTTARRYQVMTEIEK